MKKRSLAFIMVLALLLGFTFFNQKSFAAEGTGTQATENVGTQENYNQLYKEAISKGVIKSETKSYEQWVKENEINYMPMYKKALAQKLLPESLSYSQWLKLNNYGQPPAVSEDNSQNITVHAGGNGVTTNAEGNIVPTNAGGGEFTTNAVVDGITIKAGDVFVTNATSSSAYLGHAAIANGDYHILDMPGMWQENRQSTTAEWINQYSSTAGNWIKIYRLSNQTLAQKIASYADTHYYSSTGSATRDIVLMYELNPFLYTFNPTYCSKLVFDAEWYGSGSAPVMQGVSGYVMPYGLIDTFTSAYKPYLVATITAY